MRGIITLCGSTKFKEEFEEVNRRLTWSGWVVLSVGSFHHSEKDHDIAGQIIARKVKLDILHKEKIALSQAVVIVNEQNYIGESTRSELQHARHLGKQVYWFRFHKYAYTPFDWDSSHWINALEDKDWSELLDESPDDLKPAPEGGRAQ